MNLPPPLSVRGNPSPSFSSPRPGRSTIELCFGGNGAARAGSYDPPRPRAFLQRAAGIVQVTDGSGMRSTEMIHGLSPWKPHGPTVDEIKRPLRARFSGRFYGPFDERQEVACLPSLRFVRSMPVVVVVRRIARFYDGFGELIERLERFVETWLRWLVFISEKRSVYFNFR